MSGQNRPSSAQQLGRCGPKRVKFDRRRCRARLNRRKMSVEFTPKFAQRYDNIGFARARPRAGASDADTITKGRLWLTLCTAGLLRFARESLAPVSRGRRRPPQNTRGILSKPLEKRSEITPEQWCFFRSLASRRHRPRQARRWPMVVNFGFEFSGVDHISAK